MNSNIIYIFSSLAVCVVASSDWKIQDVPKNSKFLNPHLDEDTNLLGIVGDYDDAENSTDDAENIPDVAENSTNKAENVRSLWQDSQPPKQSKLFGLGLLGLLGNGLGYGGLYGSQYYGLGTKPSSSGLHIPYYNFPYYSHFRSAQDEKQLATNNL